MIEAIMMYDFTVYTEDVKPLRSLELQASLGCMGLGAGCIYDLGMF